MAKAGKPDEAKTLQTRITKLEARDYQEYARKNPPFKPDMFEGRKAKSDRAVLVELFTGAECPPCVAADLAFDCLERTYKPSDVVLLQYHLHIPGPDPMTNKESEARGNSYTVGGTPAVYVNGKKLDIGGGGISVAKVRYQAYREEIEPLLEKPAAVKLQASTSMKGEELTIKGSVSDLQNPGEKVALRFVLAEERIRFTGGNGLRYHHNVVRAFPGGVKGFALPNKSAEHTATVKLDELRASLNKYLDDYAKEEGVSFDDRPLALKNLRVVALVQDDATGEVLQAVRVDVGEKKGE
jgi:hypothetical protein